MVFAIHQRFWGICIPLRILLACVAYLIARDVQNSTKRVVFATAFLLVPAIGFIVHAILARPEGYSGGAVWWGQMRALHVVAFAGAFLAIVTRMSPTIVLYIMTADVLASMVEKLRHDAAGGGGSRDALVSPL